MSESRNYILFKSVVVMLLGLLLVSCGSGPKLAGLQADFERLYLVQLEMAAKKVSNRDKWSNQEDIDLALRGISLQAREAAEGTDVKIPTKIAFLRLAMIAAWQGKEKNKNYIRGVVDKGNNLCVQLTPREPTRDCALFLIIPLAIESSDIKSPYTIKFRQAVMAGSRKIPVDEANEAKEYFLAMKKLVTQVMEQFNKTNLKNYLAGHKGMLEYYQDETKRYWQRLGDARTMAKKKIKDTPQGMISDNEVNFSVCAEKWLLAVEKMVPATGLDTMSSKANECLAMGGS